MSVITISQWSAVEIFCRVLIAWSEYQKSLPKEQKCKPELRNATWDDLNDNQRLKELLTSCTKDLCIKIAKEVFGHTDPDDRSQSGNVRPMYLYDLKKDIEDNRPIVLGSWELEKMRAFISKYAPSHAVGDLVLKPLYQWIPSDMQRSFEKTSWYLYHFRDFVSDDGSRVQGVIRSIINFQEFGKFDLTNYNPEKQVPEYYFGSYEAYRDDTLMLHAKHRNTGTRNLRIFIYVGTLKPTLALGVYQNIGDLIYAGTVLLDQNNVTKDSQPTFLKFSNSTEEEQLPKYVAQFFSDKGQSFISVPKQITSPLELGRWLNQGRP